MNSTLNRIPDHVETIHLIAVCGTAMGALACMLKDRGFSVTGSDHQMYPPMSDFLRNKGITILEGFDRNHLSFNPDLVVVGNAVRRDNPEAQEMMERSLYFCSMPQAVNHFLARGKKQIVVTGTHGKTTTSSLIAWMLDSAGFDPSFIIGGILKNYDSNYRTGGGEVIVIEGDEYDTAYFDKGPKFLHYNSTIAVLTSIEFDHADIFRDLNHVKSAFHEFLSRISNQSTLVACSDDRNVSEMIQHRTGSIQTYGHDANAQWRMAHSVIHPPWNHFEVTKQGQPYETFKTRMMGDHNRLNSLAAIAVGESLNIPKKNIQKAFETFEGIKRRQEVRGVRNGITVMDDFAHHPTAVRETIAAVKPFYTTGRLIAVFEPRTNTSMRQVFQDVYPGSFDGADLICIRKPSRLDKVPEHERFSSEKLVADLNIRGKFAHHFQDTDQIIDFLIREAASGDVILIMSNGGFDNIHERLLKRL